MPTLKNQVLKPIGHQSCPHITASLQSWQQTPDSDAFASTTDISPPPPCKPVEPLFALHSRILPQ